MPAIWRNVQGFLATGAIATLTVGMIASSSLADTDGSGGPPNFMMQWDATGDQEGLLTYDPITYGTREWGVDWNLGGGPNGQGGAPRLRTGWRYIGGIENEMWSLSWDCVANADPFVDATINVTNNSGAFQTYFVVMPLVIVPQGPMITMNGSVSAVVTDGDFSSSALLSATALDPIFQGEVNGVPLANARLWNPGFSLSATSLGGSANDVASFTNQLGPAATSISVVLRFDLSPGDSASVTGIFEVLAIPGPAGLAVFAMFAGMSGRGRRRA